MRAEAALAVGSWQKNTQRRLWYQLLTHTKANEKLDLVVKQRVAYKVITKRKHGEQVADNLLNQIRVVCSQFNLKCFNKKRSILLGQYRNWLSLANSLTYMGVTKAVVIPALLVEHCDFWRGAGIF